MPERGLPGGAEHLHPGLGLDIVSGALKREELVAVASHARGCRSCEDLLRQWLGETEAVAAMALPVRGEDGRFQAARASRDDLSQRVAPVSGRGFRRRWVVSAVGAVAAAAALTLVILPRGHAPYVAEPYWIGLPTDGVVSRSVEGRNVDPRFLDGLAAYELHHAARAAELLGGVQVPGDLGDLARLYLASALYNAGRFEAASDSLLAMDLETVPQPWKDQGMWLLGLSLSASGDREAARSWFQQVAAGSGKLADRARKRLDVR